MTSRIDPTVIKDDQKVDKADLRNQFEIAATEITELQKVTSTPRKMAYGDNIWDEI